MEGQSGKDGASIDVRSFPVVDIATNKAELEGIKCTYEGHRATDLELLILRSINGHNGDKGSITIRLPFADEEMKTRYDENTRTLHVAYTPQRVRRQPIPFLVPSDIRAVRVYDAENTQL